VISRAPGSTPYPTSRTPLASSLSVCLARGRRWSSKDHAATPARPSPHSGLFLGLRERGRRGIDSAMFEVLVPLEGMA